MYQLPIRQRHQLLASEHFCVIMMMMIMSNCVHFRPTINKSVSTKHKLIKHTLALGFNVDFSEDKEPSDELGDKPRPPEAETAPAHSELEDAELPGRP